ncbi:unnamed protein product [Alopecurus aequalis]
MAAAAAAAAAGVGGGGGGERSSSPAGLAIGSHHGSTEEATWQMTLGGRGESMESGPYPERVGEPDCSYYMRTGLCRFGITCKFNHPPNRKMAVAAARMKGEYPYRVGQPECQYFLKTGTCKFGATCKFHHPRVKAAIATRAQLNVLGYPLRPNEKECTYYLRTGQCKFASTCKFHHPQPSSTMVAVRSSIYSPGQSATSHGQNTYPGAVTNWSMSRPASFVASPRWPGPSGYAQVIVPQGLVQVPGWNPYAGEPVCTFYSRYGICKFGPNCKFDHPMGALMYGAATSRIGDAPPLHYQLAPSPGHSERLLDGGSGRPHRVSQSDSQQILSGDGSAEREAS